MFNLNQFIMQKKNLFVGLLLCSAFLFTGCKEIMSHLDNSVDSHLQVADKVTVIGVGDTYTITKDVDYATISDAAPKFESQTPAIATVDPQTGAVKALKSGDARIKISLPDNGLYLDASAVIDIKVRVKDTDGFIKNVEALNPVDEILLAENATIDLTSKEIPSIIFNGDVAIKGVKGKPATIKAVPFIMKKKIAFENIYIDAAGLASKNLLTYSDEPDESLNTGTAESPRYNIYGDAIKFENVVVDNIPRGIISDNGKCYIPENVIISNSILHFVPASGNQNAIHFNTNNNGIKNLKIEESTIYASGNNKLGYFVKYANNARIDRFGYDSNKDKIEFHFNKNTFYGLCSNYFHNYGSALKNYAIFDITKNIFYYNNTNSTQTKQIVQRIVGQASKSAGTELNFDGNAFLHNGTPYDCNQSDDNKQSYNVDTNSVSYDPGFTDPAQGNFKPTDGHFTSEEAPGDPRWRK